jgi:hypothetical protein
MKSISVNVQEDHLQSLASAKRPLLAVAELIWNAFDADATSVRVSVIRNSLTGLEMIRVVDDGHGLEYRRAEEEFAKLGGSWKRARRRTIGGRFLHGKEGKGRFRAFALGNHIIWRTRYRENGKTLEYTITGHRASLKRFDLSDASPSTETASGTDVEVTDLLKDFTSLEGDAAVQGVTEQFALYLRQYPNVHLTYNGTRVDPAAVMVGEETVPLREFIDRKHVDAQLTIIEWRNPTDRALYLCDSDGFPLTELQPRIHAPGFHFTAYLRSDYFRSLQEENTLGMEELHPGVKAFSDAARGRMRDYFRRRAAERAASLVDQWKKEQVYPYEGTATNAREEVERQVFDVVAYNVHSYLPTFADADTANRRLTFHLLRHAVESSPGAVRQIIQNVLDLPPDRQKELAELLERMSFDAIISAARIVADRLDFIRGLELLVFDPTSKEQLQERTQLHRILATQTWIFGEEFNLTVDDQGLTKVLEAHLHLLGRDPAGTIVRRENGSVGIVDLMLSRALSDNRNRREHLVVELKAPKVELTPTHTDQIESYAFAVAKHEQFRDTNTTWTFVLLGNDYSDSVRRKISQRGRPKGVLLEPADHEGVNFTIWVKTWAQLIEDCKARLRFFQERFNYFPEDDSALAYLRATHAKLLPKIFSPDPDVASPSDDDAHSDDQDGAS